MEKSVEGHIRKLIQEDDSLTDANNCRNSVDKLALELMSHFPNIKINLLAYPEAKQGVGVHYALSVESGEDELLVNPVAAPGFPQFIGPRSMAVPTFSAMKEAQKVK